MEDASPTLENSGGMRSSTKPDALNSEFLYYSSALKVIAPTLTNDIDRQNVVPWMKKLFRPEYHSSRLREKRNKFLLYLTLTLLNDELYGIFVNPPPVGVLPEFRDIPLTKITAAEWELETMWQNTLQNLPEDLKKMECSVHENHDDCANDHDLDTILDQEFQFLLYLAKPYAALIKGRYESTRVAMWLQTLCTVYGNICSSMRGIRNDYIMALLGYVYDQRLIGPFADYPPLRTLPPLAEAAKLSTEPKPLTDPSSVDANNFLALQPAPEEGAFCYIAITGDLIDGSFSEN